MELQKKNKWPTVGNVTTDVDDVFSTYLYAGDGNNAREINNGIDLSGEGGMVWFKARTTAQNHRIFDTERGSDYSLITNSAAAQTDHGSTGLNSFDNDGFTLGNAVVNGSGIYGGDYTSWTWRKATNWFDIVSYTGNNGTQTINHNLGSVPGMIIVKRLNDAGNWSIYHRSLGATKFINLNSTSQAYANSSYWADTAPTSTQFTVGLTSSVDSAPYIAYLFAHHNNDGEFGPNQDQDIIKCGSYNGDGQSAGVTVDLGFEPQWIFLKRSDASGYYTQIIDNMRGMPNGSNDQILWPNVSDAENGTLNSVEPTATGFKAVDTNNSNINGSTWVYMAIRRGPLAEPESASDVFAISTSGQGGDSKAPAYRSTFPVDMYFEKKIDGTGDWFISSRLTENLYMKTNSTAAEVADSNLDYDFMNGVYNTTGSANAYYGWMWKRAPGYFDVVTYVGAGAAQTVNHNLGVVPEMMWVKSRSTADDWAVYHSALGNTDNLFLNGNNATASRIYWNNTTPTATQFSLGDSSKVSNSGTTYIAYLFATVAGVSKVGSYTGDATDGRQIDCGFTSGAKFVLIKRADSTGNWMVFDTKRGIVAGNDPFLKLNSNGAETSTDDKLDPYNAGFIVNHSGGSINNSGATFIFYAIAT